MDQSRTKTSTVKGRNNQKLKRAIIWWTLIALGITLLSAIIGCFIGSITSSGVSDWPINIGGNPNGTEGLEGVTDFSDWRSFWIKKTIQEFSFYGAVVGVIIGGVLQVPSVRYSRKTN
jgi:hypothetical protein